MADVAAHLVDRVLPKVPVRQWVLSLPRPIRFLLARDAKLLSGVLRIFVKEVFRDLRRRSGVKPARSARCGAVTAVQRFGGAINLNVHFHSIVLDGVYVRDPSTGRERFVKADAPSREDLERVLERTRREIREYLADRGYTTFGEAAGGGEVQEAPGVFDVVQAASIREWAVFTETPGRVEVVGKDPGMPFLEASDKPLCAEGEGFSLHAAVRIRAADRKGLEQLCRYLLRPPFAGERIEELADGRVGYRFRRPRPDGSTHAVMEPVEFLGKLAALVPPPRSHLVHYHGVLGPNSRSRRGVVPKGGRRKRRPSDGDGCCGEGERAADGRRKPRSEGARRTEWAKLMRRSMGLDVLACPRCRGRLEFDGCVEEPAELRQAMEDLGLPLEGPLLSPARPPPQGRFEFDQ